ncbi:MAG: winged helix-turn-helix domain-containing protein [Ardenticatenaceae bacterium]|nr:winged helix-turn-helix domain-containing protein [Ardenticatenaceae bacterium]
MARLSLAFLGVFQAELNGEPLLHFRSANVQGLLVYLVMQAERPFPRDTLATLFWPTDTDATAKKNLRQSLYQLRKVLNDSDDSPQPFLLVTRQTVQFNPAADCSLDLDQFLAACGREDWQTAVSLYAGTLLPGFFCDSEPFEEWLRLEREHFYHLALDSTLSIWEHWKCRRLAGRSRTLYLHPLPNMPNVPQNPELSPYQAV